MQPSIEFVVFDLDGTLLDSVPDLAIAADKAARELGFAPVSEAQVRDYVGNGADILIARSLSQSLIIDESLTAETRQQARVLFDRYYAETHHQQSRLYDGVLETLEALKQRNIPMAIVTNKPSKFVPEILAQHEIDGYFAEVLGGDAFEQRKPHPVALQHIMHKYGVSPDSMLMVGDSKNDILAAKNAGCQSFGLTYGYNHGEPIADSKPNFVADKVVELVALLT